MTLQLNENWTSIKDGLPDDSIGRVLCWCEEVNDLGVSHFFWNCSYSKLHGFTDDGKTYRVTHWKQILPPNSQPTPQPLIMEGQVPNDNAFMNGGNTDTEKAFYKMGYLDGRSKNKSEGQGKEVTAGERKFVTGFKVMGNKQYCLYDDGTWELKQQ